MKERPILFNGPMVRALLDGSKTQTRRIVKPDPGPYWFPTVGLFNPTVIRNGGYLAPGPEIFGASDENIGIKCPYGQPGDRLWVKETWRPWAALGPWDLNITYAADGEDRLILDGEFGEREWTMPKAAARGNVSPLFMPRWASRITLEVTGVRVERLQDISETDAQAEGSDCLVFDNCTKAERDFLDMPLMENGSPYRSGFALLWESINGAASWHANPWDWVVEFRRVEP